MAKSRQDTNKEPFLLLVHRQGIRLRLRIRLVESPESGETWLRSAALPIGSQVAS